MDLLKNFRDISWKKWNLDAWFQSLDSKTAVSIFDFASHLYDSRGSVEELGRGASDKPCSLRIASGSPWQVVYGRR